jgi:STE24 endopeptidase
VKRSQAITVLGPVALAAASAELAVRALSPRRPAPEPVPVDLRKHFSAAELARGRRYARPQLALSLARAAVDSAALAAVVARTRRRGAPLARVARTDADCSYREAVLAGAATGAGLSAALSLPGLPLAAAGRQRSLAVGLSTQPWRAWFVDLAKSTAIQSLLAAAGGGAMIALMRRWPQHWWLPAAGGSVLFGASFATLAPVVLDPVFNDFTPLPDGEVRADVLELARAAGVTVGEVYSVDASRRTTAANAYVTGLGPTKRVVLFDTLLSRYTRDEIRVVVAHELAHVRNRDVIRGVAFAALTAPASALAVQRLSWALSPLRGSAASLPAIALALGVVSVPVTLSSTALSRRIERQADEFSLELAGAPDAFVSFERKVALQNVADLDPPRIVSLLSTHPSTGERIGAALAHKTGRALPAP